MKRTPKTLEQKLLNAISLERRAVTRVKRAATLLQKRQRDRKRIEKRIGEAEVRRIVNRLRLSVEPSPDVLGFLRIDRTMQIDQIDRFIADYPTHRAQAADDLKRILS